MSLNVVHAASMNCFSWFYFNFFGLFFLLTDRSNQCNDFKKLNRTAVLAILCIICLGFGVNMEKISSWGPWMDIVSIYIIPIGATLGALSWFWIMKKNDFFAVPRRL